MRNVVKSLDLFAQTHPSAEDENTFVDEYFHTKKWDFIATVVIDMTPFDPSLYSRGVDTLSHDILPICARTLDAEAYFQDVAANIATDEIDQIIEFDKNDDYEPGIYRIVFGCQIESSQSTNFEGITEYDEYYHIDVISRIRYSSADESYIVEDLQREEERTKHYWAREDRMLEYERLDRMGYFDELRAQGKLTSPAPDYN